MRKHLQGEDPTEDRISESIFLTKIDISRSLFDENSKNIPNGFDPRNVSAGSGRKGKLLNGFDPRNVSARTGRKGKLLNGFDP